MAVGMSPETLVEISVSQEFHEFIPAATLRLKYLFPEVDIEATVNGVRLSGTAKMDASQIEAEITYQVYREKVFQQTLPMRRDLYQMLAK